MDSDLFSWGLLGGAIAGTYLWRALGVVFSARIEPQGAVFIWITCVSYSMLAALIARMVVMPVGPLLETPLPYRVAGIAVGLAAFFLSGRRLLVAVGLGFIVFVCLIAGA